MLDFALEPKHLIFIYLDWSINTNYILTRARHANTFKQDLTSTSTRQAFQKLIQTKTKHTSKL